VVSDGLLLTTIISADSTIAIAQFSSGQLRLPSLLSLRRLTLYTLLVSWPGSLIFSYLAFHSTFENDTERMRRYRDAKIVHPPIGEGIGQDKLSTQVFSCRYGLFACCEASFWANRMSSVPHMASKHSLTWLVIYKAQGFFAGRLKTNLYN
jgi:hypothetical protein